MKGDILLTVLEKLMEGVGSAAELFAAFIEAGYGASPRRMAYGLRQNLGTRRAARMSFARTQTQSGGTVHSFPR